MRKGASSATTPRVSIRQEQKAVSCCAIRLYTHKRCQQRHEPAAGVTPRPRSGTWCATRPGCATWCRQPSSWAGWAAAQASAGWPTSLVRDMRASRLTLVCDWRSCRMAGKVGHRYVCLRPWLCRMLCMRQCCWQGFLQGFQDDMVGNTCKGCAPHRACHSGAANKQIRATGRRRALGAACAMAALFGAASALAPAFWWCVRRPGCCAHLL